MSNFGVLIASWVFLALILSVSSALVFWLVSLIRTQNQQMMVLIRSQELERAEWSRAAEQERKELAAYALRDRSELLNRLMTKTWQEFVGVQSTQTQTETLPFEPSISPEETMEYDPKIVFGDMGLGEVLVELDNGALSGT